MIGTVRIAIFRHLRLPLVILCFVAFSTILFARGKEHPIQGTVTAVGTSQDTTSVGGSVITHVRRTYTVKTDARVLVLECPYDMEALHIFAPSECGGKKKIAIGDAIRFRLEKNHAFVLTAEGKDEKLRVVSEAMIEAGNAPSSPKQP